jgi:oxygen-independent coproporphyrinogen-3 oxidase
VIVERNSGSEHLHVIIKGSVEECDDDAVEAILGAKDSFDARAVVHGAAGARFIAAEETLCYLAPRSTILTLIRRNPGFAAFFYSEISRKLEGYSRRQGPGGVDSVLRARVRDARTHPAVFIDGSVTIEAAGRVPRYTSYPTAPHFSAAVGPQVYGTWLAELPDTAALSLYLHVPYCKELCLYCGCTTKAVRRRGPVEAYAEHLKKEIDLLGAVIGGRHAVHLHWGGGTPSMLGPDRLIEVVDRLSATFDLTGIAEHAIELDPRRVTPQLACALGRIGVTRASFGAQDFSPHVQQAIGRVQPFQEVEAAVAAVRAAGIANVNIDLMYGLPRQTVGDVIRSAELAASLAPSRLALFGYAHVPWFKPHQRLIDEEALPGADERMAQMHAAAETLEECGYVQIGLDHFASLNDDMLRAAQTGALHRNFQGYTTDAADALIGLGASSIGRLPQGYVQNAPDVGSYARAIDAGQFAVAKGLALTADDRVRALIIERLMCDLAVDLDAHSGAMDLSAELAAVDALSASGIVRRHGRRVVVTEKGRPFVRLIAAAFDAYLPENHKRHSVAV